MKRANHFRDRRALHEAKIGNRKLRLRSGQKLAVEIGKEFAHGPR
jgi:hypothetical protein